MLTHTTQVCGNHNHLGDYSVVKKIPGKNHDHTHNDGHHRTYNVQKSIVVISESTATFSIIDLHVAHFLLLAAYPQCCLFHHQL